MSALYDTLKQDVQKLVTDFNKANEDHVLTLAEVWVLVQDGIALFVNATQKLDGDDKVKKTAVMEAAALFYDDVLVTLIASSISGPFGGIVARMGKNVYLELVSGTVDWIIKTSHKPVPVPGPTPTPDKKEGDK